MGTKKIVTAGLIILIIGCGFIPLHVLKIDALREKKTVYTRIIRPLERLAIGFIHSVEHCPVRDYFTIDQAFRLVLVETTFASSNTGLPYTCSGKETFSSDGKQFRIANRHIVFSSIDLWVDRKYENMLQFGDQKVLQLPSLAGNTLLRVSTAEVPAAYYIFLKAASLTHAIY